MNYVLMSCGDIKDKLLKKGLKPKHIISFDVNEYNQDNIISIYKLKKEYNDEKILIPSFISDDTNIDDIYNQLIDMEFNADNILFIPIEMIYGEEKIDDKQFYKYGETTYLDYLEINIIDRCNMNCKGCSHFANIAPKGHKNFDNYSNDLLRLKELFPHIFKIRIMGGEPLLNPDVFKYIKLIKQLYPYTDLRVVTNGLLLNTLKEEELLCLEENDVMLDISVYPPLQNNIDDIVSSLKEKNIKIFLEHINKFKPILMEEETIYPFTTLDNCKCITLQNGYLAPCPLPFTINYFNDKFNNVYDKKVKLINIYDQENGADIKQMLKEPFELCNYCAHYRNDLPFFKWEQKINNCEISDWVYKKEKK